MSTPYRVTDTYYDHTGAVSDPDDGGHSTDGGRVYGITKARYAECERYGCKPVVVVDPEDRDSGERLAKALVEAAHRHGNYVVSDGGIHGSTAQEALRHMLAPPTPSEPTAMWSRVEDSDGEEWVRILGPEFTDGWVRVGSLPSDGKWTDYRDIKVARVTSEGVQ